MKKSWLSLAALTLWYSLALATIMQVAHTLTRVLLSLATASTFLEPVVILGELASKIAWAVLACEALVLLSMIARRRWLLIVFAAGLSVLAGGILGAYFRSIVETTLGSVSDFVWQAAFHSSTLLSSKYFLVGAAVAWANCFAKNSLWRYLTAGLIAAIGASLITFTTMNAEWIAKLGTIAIDFVFPLGCCAIVWKLRKMTEWIADRHNDVKSEIKNI